MNLNFQELLTDSGLRKRTVLPDVLALQGYVCAIVQIQVSQGHFSLDAVRVFFIVPLF